MWSNQTINHKTMKQKMTKQEAGRLGEKKAHATRYELLIKLSSKYGKNFQEAFMKTWKTEQLQYLWDSIKNDNL